MPPKLPCRLVQAWVVWLAGLLVAATGADAQESTRTLKPTALEGMIMVIYDSSASMSGEVKVGWGGERKFQVAQREFARLIDRLGEIDASVDVGLMAYGHRRRGDCQDIEVLSAPAGNHDPAHRERLKATVAGLKNRGMTPIADSILAAARALKYTERRAVVVLISDGVEECGGDPCRVAAELKRDGIDFTAHVVGFDLDQKELEALTCVARETDGQVLAASDAADLARVVDDLAQRIAREEWQRQRGTASFGIAIDGRGGRIEPPSGTAVVITPADGAETAMRVVFRGTSAMASLPPGRYTARLAAAVAAPEIPFAVEPAGVAPVTFAVRPSRLVLSARTERAELFAAALAAPVRLSVKAAEGGGSDKPVASADNALKAELPPGRWRVVGRYDEAVREETVDLPMEEVETLEIVFGPGRVEAMVVNQDDHPLDGPAVSWTIEPLDFPGVEPVVVARAALSTTLPPGRYRLTGRFGVEQEQAKIKVVPEQMVTVKLRIFEPK